MPMGSDRWAEHCLTLLCQRREEASALRAVMGSIEDAKAKRDRANDGHWIEQRKRLVADYQRRADERDTPNAPHQARAIASRPECGCSASGGKP